MKKIIALLLAAVMVMCLLRRLRIQRLQGHQDRRI